MNTKVQKVQNTTYNFVGYYSIVNDMLLKQGANPLKLAIRKRAKTTKLKTNKFLILLIAGAKPIYISSLYKINNNSLTFEFKGINYLLSKGENNIHNIKKI